MEALLAPHPDPHRGLSSQIRTRTVIGTGCEVLKLRGQGFQK
ncbi:uncharacterized protein PGTG_00512 [Puccinia graminis f. sp. tritici CRL 75-36-700-3]|uniref:Uncharacterized protein n=1 Tax=Puccinia graminis f. sp. tritici (strain CRL 75-36-700-3 / race SCCL) TaxID=418459 RepID=E3JPU3_PUCGT|nr:uncharacterized protein PGTG_00512 [Puccinia graminis f. sp. tritici CRL 75-36-700-3]EFP74556.1 hypothetical protein PGTG_00512 [Puccinia graminis f. sp. tritici CRL 75-36-700-3]